MSNAHPSKTFACGRGRGERTLVWTLCGPTVDVGLEVGDNVKAAANVINASRSQTSIVITIRRVQLKRGFQNNQIAARVTQTHGPIYRPALNLCQQDRRPRAERARLRP
jgi:hypothetical protein